MARYYDPIQERWITVDDDSGAPAGGFSSVDGAQEYDPYNAIRMRSLGYMPDIGLSDTANQSGAGGQRFTNAQDYYNYLYGNVTPETIGGNLWYKTPNGADAYLPGRSPIQYNPPDSAGFGLTLGAIAAMAGAGLMGGEGALASGAGSGGGSAGVGFGELGSGVFGLGEAAPVYGGISSTGGALGSGLAGIEGAGLGLGGLETVGGAGAGLTAGLGELGSGTFGLGSAPTYGGISSTGGALGTGTAGVEGMGAGVTGAGEATGAASAGAVASQSGSALSRILNGTATTADYLSTFGNLAGTGLGLLGANQQSSAMGDIANRYLDMGAPYRGLLQQSYQPGFNLATADPAYQGALDQAAQSAARATSARVGNPTENPGAYAEMQKYITGSLALPQLNTYRSQLGTFGQLGVNQAGTAQMGEAQAKGGMYDALGYGIGQMTQPDNPFRGLLDQFRMNINSTRSF